MFDWLRSLRAARGSGGAERKLLAWHSLGRPAWSARDPSVFAREGYAQNAIAYRCVRMIAEAAASAPLKVGPADHPLSRLLARPNPEQTGVELLEAFYGHLQVAGNAYLEAAGFDDEAPAELYVLRPDRMSVVPGGDGWPVGWEHRVGASVRRFARDPISHVAPILHLKLFNPTDDWYGLSPMEAAAFSIDIHNAGGAWNKALIDNAARPSGALVFSGAAGADRLSEEQFRRLKLIDLIYTPKTQFRQNARFVMNRKTVSAVRKLKDGDGRYIWEPNDAGGSTLLGYQITELEDMPDIATDAAAIAFGDFARGYLIVDRAGVRVLRDPYSAKPYVLFYVTKRVGGGVQNFDAIKVLKFGDT